jgi:hypothetical protein
MKEFLSDSLFEYAMIAVPSAPNVLETFRRPGRIADRVRDARTAEVL